MQTEHTDTAHSLYDIYEALPSDIQQAFLNYCKNYRKAWKMRRFTLLASKPRKIIK